MKKRISIVFAIIGLVYLISGCGMPRFQPPYSQINAPAADIKAIKKVLLLGPEFDQMGLVDDGWLKDTKNTWQKEIIAKWGEFNKDNRFFEIIAPDSNHYSMLAELLAEQKLKEVPLFDMKTGQINAAYMSRVRTAYGKLAQKAGVDAIMYMDFVIVPVAIQHNVAMWDGQFENIASLSFGRMFTAVLGDTTPESYHGKAPGLSLFAQLIDKDGRVLLESRGGYKILTEVKVGAFSNDQKTLSFKEAFKEKYKSKRNLAIMWALNAVAKIEGSN